MKQKTAPQKLLRAFFILSVCLLSSLRTSAQNKPVLPGGLKQNSSVAEIVKWLDQTTFRKARVVLKDTSDIVTYRPPWDDSEPAKGTFIFTQGFRVTNIDGCNLMLRNDDARMVDKSKVDDSIQPLVVDVWVQLDRMSASKGKRTHRYTRDPEKVRLLGAWRTEFKYKGWFSRTIVGLTFHSPAWKGANRWNGWDVAFTFDAKEMSEQFDAAFRHAIKLCKSK